MFESNLTGEPEVSCSQCLEEIPQSAATVPEARWYFVHFCGLDCFRKWKEKEEDVHDHNSDEL